MDPIEPISRDSYLFDLVRVYRKMMDLDGGIAANFKEDAEIFQTQIREIRKEELELVKKGGHHPWAAFIFGAATVATIAAFFFTTPAGGLQAGVSLFPLANTVNNFVSDHYSTQTLAEQKKLAAFRAIAQKKIQEEAEKCSDLEKTLAEVSSLMRRFIDQTQPN